MRKSTALKIQQEYCMKTTTIITHPITLICSFALIFICKENDGNFYVVLLAAGLIHGELHAITGLLGMIMLMASYRFYKGPQHIAEASLVNLAGALLLILSLFLYYYHYLVLPLTGSTRQLVHLVTLVTFCILVSIFVIVYPLQQKDSINPNLH